MDIITRGPGVGVVRVSLSFLFVFHQSLHCCCFRSWIILNWELSVFRQACVISLTITSSCATYDLNSKYNGRAGRLIYHFKSGNN